MEEIDVKQSLYIYNSGDLKRKDNTLRFTNYEGEKRDVPIERISDIYVMSEMSFNTAFLNYISKYGISIHFFNYYNYYTGSYYPKDALLAGGLLVKQAEYYREVCSCTQQLQPGINRIRLEFKV